MAGPYRRLVMFDLAAGSRGSGRRGVGELGEGEAEEGVLLTKRLLDAAGFVTSGVGMGGWGE